MSEPLLDRVRALAAILAETGVGEIEVTEGGRRIRVAAPQAGAHAPPLAPEAPPPPASNEVAPERPAIRAPMHGVFHRAPGPGAPPFVAAGDTVTPGQTVGIVEAMKVFNPVLATEAGAVAAFAAENGQDVAAGQVLLTLVPA